MQNYGQKVKQIRSELKLSQRALAEKVKIAGVNRDTVNSYERGTARVTAAFWDKLLTIQRELLSPSQEQGQ